MSYNLCNEILFFHPNCAIFDDNKNDVNPFSDYYLSELTAVKLTISFAAIEKRARK